MDDKERIIQLAKENILGVGFDKTADDGDDGSDGIKKVAGFSGMAQDPYPSPFLNLSDTQIPSTTIELLRWCKYFYTFDPLINGAVNALATFPVTPIHLEDIKGKKTNDESDEMKDYKRVLFENLNIYKLMIEIGIDYYLYGNCFVFGQMGTNKVTGQKEWKSVTRLDPSRMIIDHNPATNTVKYKWQVPFKIRDLVKRKTPVDEYNKIPDIIKEAVRQNKALVLNNDNVYHFSRATDSMGESNVWGVPIVANVIKLLMYRNTLRQAQEAIAREHIVPMRLFYLDNTSSYNVNANWEDVSRNLANQLQMSVRDPNYKVVSPVPVQVVNVGGEGRALLLTAEIQQIQDEILAGMNLPREFIFGGVSYSGSSISLKILENQFITYRLLMKDFLQNFLIKGMAKARGEWKSQSDDDLLITVKLMDLKMQDDVQQKQLIIQLNSAGKCTDEYMWKALGLDTEKIREGLEQEAMAGVELKHKTQQRDLELQKQTMKKEMELKKLQIEQEMELQRFQMELQARMGMNAPQEEEGQVPPGVAPQEQAEQQVEEQPEQPVEQPIQPELDPEFESQLEQLAIKMVNLPQAQIDTIIRNLPQSAREKVLKKYTELKNTSGDKIDMRPLPENKPPRRESLK